MPPIIAISSIFKNYPRRQPHLFLSRSSRKTANRSPWAKPAWPPGRIKIIFEITRSSDVLTYAVFHTGDHTINCAVKEDGDKEGYAKMVQELRGPFEHGDFPEMIRVMDRHFGPVHYSVQHLFHDEQREVLDKILAHPRDEIYSTLRHITEYYAPLHRFMADMHTPPLKALGMATEIVLNNELRRQLQGDKLDLERIRGLLAECAATKTPLYSNDMAYALKGHFDRVGDCFAADYRDMDGLQQFVDAAELARMRSFQNQPVETAKHLLQPDDGRACRKCGVARRDGNEQAKEWVEKFLLLGEKLGFAVDAQPK